MTLLDSRHIWTKILISIMFVPLKPQVSAYLIAIGGSEESASSETIVFDENLGDFPIKVSKAIGGFDPSTGIAIVCGGVSPLGLLHNDCFKMEASMNNEWIKAWTTQLSGHDG